MSASINRQINDTNEKLVINTIRCLGADLTQEVRIVDASGLGADFYQVQRWASWHRDGCRCNRRRVMALRDAVQPKESRMVRLSQRVENH